MLRAERAGGACELDVVAEFLAAAVHCILFAHGVYPHSKCTAPERLHHANEAAMQRASALRAVGSSLCRKFAV